MSTRALRIALLLALLSPLAHAEVTVTVCGNLFGAQQTAIRMRDSGFPILETVKETLNRGEWRNAPTAEQQLAIRLVEETYRFPERVSSEVIRECRDLAYGSRQNDPEVMRDRAY